MTHGVLFRMVVRDPLASHQAYASVHSFAHQRRRCSRGANRPALLNKDFEVLLFICLQIELRTVGVVDVFTIRVQ